MLWCSMLVYGSRWLLFARSVAEDCALLLWRPSMANLCLPSRRAGAGKGLSAEQVRPQRSTSPLWSSYLIVLMQVY